MRQRFFSMALGAGAAVLIFTFLVGGSAIAQTDSGTSLGGTFLNRLAENLGISRDELDSTIQQSGNQVIDEAIQNGDLTQEQGDAYRQRFDTTDGFFGFGGGPGFLGRGRGMLHTGFSLQTIADQLGITRDELMTELQSGSTLSDIITTHGSSVDAVVQALVADAQTKLDEAVANGRITQEQADQMLANLPDQLTQQIENGMLGPGCDGPMPGVDGNNNDNSGNSDSTSA